MALLATLLGFVTPQFYGFTRNFKVRVVLASIIKFFISWQRSVVHTVGYPNVGRLRQHCVVPNLNADVMEAICNSIDDIHDLLSVSLTCSEMRRIAIRQLLKMHTIRLSTRKSIRGFRDLVINQKPTLAHHLNSIVIPETAWTTYEPAYPSKDVEDVMDILDCAVNLDTLDISLDAPYVVTSRVFSTFATFKVLRDLTLTDAALLPGDASWTHHALGALRSPLVSLCIRDKKHLSSSSLVPSTLASDFDQSFSRFSTLSTLTTLHLGLIPVYEDSFLQLPRFLSVRSLIISRPIVGEPNLAALLHLFPSLDGTLSLRMERVASSSIIFNRAKFNRVREKNQLAQGSSGGWTNLDRLDCEPATAQILALLCPVRHFTTDALDYPSLDVVRPRHLVIDSIRLPFYTDISRHYGDEIASMSASSVTHVVLIVQCEAKEYEDAKKKFEATEDIRWKTVLKHTVKALAVFPHLTHARLVFYCNKDRTCNEELDGLVRNVRDWSLSRSRSPPRQVLAACPALRCFVMTVASRDETESDSALQGWVRTHAWRVVEPHGGQGHTRIGGAGKGSHKRPRRAFEKLSDYDARRIIEGEDMGLPEAWERKLEAILVRTSHCATQAKSRRNRVALVPFLLRSL